MRSRRCSGTARTATVTATAPSTVRIIGDPDAFFASHPEIGLELARQLAGRLHRLLAYLGDVAAAVRRRRRPPQRVRLGPRAGSRPARTSSIEPGSDRSPDYSSSLGCGGDRETAQRHLAGALEGPPRRRALVEVEEHVAGRPGRRWWPPLNSHVGARAARPSRRPSHERRLVDVAAQHDVGAVLLEQPGELRVAVVPRPVQANGPSGGPWYTQMPRPVPLLGGAEPARPPARASVAGPSHQAHERDQPTADA